MWDGEPLKRSTLFEDVVCDPLAPISVIRRSMNLAITFKCCPRWNTHLQVTCDTLVEDVIKFVTGCYPEITGMVLPVNG
jgi:hypothetical protein